MATQKTKIAGTGRTGFINLGNTCYMSSVLQSLSHVNPLRRYCFTQPIHTLANWRGPADREGWTAFLFALNLIQTWSGKFSSIRYELLKKLMGRLNEEFVGFQQCDAPELLQALVENIHSDLLKPTLNIDLGVQNHDNIHSEGSAHWLHWKSQNDSIMVDLFHFQIVETITCPHCTLRRYNFDPVWQLILPLEQSRNQKSLHTLLGDKFRGYQSDVKVSCNVCEERSISPKGDLIWTLPKFLIIQFQRRVMLKLWPPEYTKTTTPVNYPVKGLDMTEFCHPENPQAYKLYDLFAVVNHMGDFNCGHYTTYAKTSSRANSSGWRHFNDDRVTDITENEVVNENAYILFYKKRKT